MAGSEAGVPRVERDHSEGTMETELSDWDSSDSGEAELGNGCSSQRESEDLGRQEARTGVQHKELPLFCGLPPVTQTIPDLPSSALDWGDSGRPDTTELPKPLQPQEGEGQKRPVNDLTSAPPEGLLKPEEGAVRAQKQSEVNRRLQTLSSLLPQSSSKRDRFQILTDTLVYVDNKRQLLSELQQRYRSLKLAAQQTAQAPTRKVGEDSQDLKVRVLYNGVEDVVITMKCKSSCASSLIRALLRAVERFDMEVFQCNVLKSCGYFLCDAICKRITDDGSMPPYDVLVRELTTSIRSSCSPSAKLSSGSKDR